MTTRQLLDNLLREAQLHGDLRRFIDKHDHRSTAAFTEAEARSWRLAVAAVAGRAERFGSGMA